MTKIELLQKKLYANTTILSVAHHEAAHAVMQYIVDDNYQSNGKILSIEIFDKQDGYLNVSRYFPTYFINNPPYEGSKILPQNKIFKQFQKYAMVNFAGYYAEIKFRKIRGFSKAYIGDDYQKILNEVVMANKMFDKEVFSDFTIFIWHDSMRKLVNNRKVWFTIQELARKLEECLYLETEEIYEILDRNLKDFTVPRTVF